MNSAGEIGQSSAHGWLGASVRLLVTLFFLLVIAALSRCGSPTPPATPVPTAAAGTGSLRIEVRPHGSTVIVDGFRSGTTPAILTLPAGQHTIRVEQNGYEPMVVTLEVANSSETALTGSLVGLVTATGPTVTLVPTWAPETHTPLPNLAIRQVKIEMETGSSCDYTSTQLGVRIWIENTGGADAGSFVVAVDGVQQEVAAGLAVGQTISLWFPGYAASGESSISLDVTFQVEESDEGDNTFSQLLPIPTLPPTCTPPPAAVASDTPTPPPPPTTVPPPPPPPAAVTVHEGQVTIPTYPYADFTTQAWNETFRMPYTVLDRAAYDGSGPSPREMTYRTMVIENDYLKLTFLPEIGGRIYEVVYKPTGHRETYRNPVLKPSRWGPPEQGWWLAAGGFEWCLPVEEHGYQWGVPWNLSISQDAKGVTVIVRDTESNDRVRAEIAVRLQAGAGYFTIRPRLENPTGAPVAVKYWTNAMLAPGGRNAPSAELRFVLPQAVTAVTVHSRGDDFLPGYNERLPWPVFNGVDLSRLGNWNRWLGFFEDPAVGEFLAAYDEGYDEGMVRVFPADVARGAKGFAFGWNDAIPAGNWTDDGSGYVEIHGGPAPTFDQSVTIPAGGQLQWTETWYPVAGLGGLRYANSTAALNLAASAGQAHVAAAVTHSWSGDVVLLLDGQERWREGVSLVPGQSLRRAVPLGEGVPQRGRLTLRLQATGGTVAAEYSADFDLE